MIVLFSDFGLNGPYLGQVKAVLHQEAPGVPVIDLFANAPAHDPRASAYLLAAYGAGFPPGFPESTVFFAVVDPGVGGARKPGVLEADGRWYVGPDNGLFEIIIRRAKAEPRWWDIRWRPERLSETFHGRDLFAPVAARLARGETPAPDNKDNAAFKGSPLDGLRRPDWPDDLAEIIYIDDFGNAMTGVRAETVAGVTELTVGGAFVGKARRFSDVPEGEAFFYENANGLLEISVNQGRADNLLKLSVGSQVAFIKK